MTSDLISRPRPLRPQPDPSRRDRPKCRGGGGDGPAPGAFLRRRDRRCDSSSGTERRSGRQRATRCRCARPTPSGGLLWAPGELGLARAFVVGDLAFEGDIFEILAPLHAAAPERIHVGSRLPWQALQAARRLGVLGEPAPAATRGGGAAGPPALAESRRAGGAAPLRRQQRLLRHGARACHDLLLRTVRPGGRDARGRAGVEARPRSAASSGWPTGAGQRILDVGCGWGSFAIHAARHYGARVVGVTLSPAQARWARDRVAAAGLDDQVEIRLQDYRDVRDGAFDGIASVGMFEHVGSSKSAEYFATMRRLLGPEGRLLNHAISSVGGSRIGPRTFIGRYVFPDGELIDVGAGGPVDGGGGVRGARRRVTPRALRQDSSSLGREPAAPLGCGRGGGRACAGRASGSSTWRRRPTGSKTAASPSTRCSASCPGPTAGAACLPPAVHGAELRAERSGTDGRFVRP